VAELTTAATIAESSPSIPEAVDERASTFQRVDRNAEVAEHEYPGAEVVESRAGRPAPSNADIDATDDSSS